MRKSLSLVAIVAVFAMVALAPAFAADSMQGTWTGEVLDLACYVSHGAHGPGHAACAKKCAMAGQPMGLLTDDGTVLLLAADHDNGQPFEALKDLAGGKAEISGEMAENGGVKMVTVKSAKAAS